MSDELYDYIASALNVPVGSADAERGFSILFHSLDPRRSQQFPDRPMESFLRMFPTNPDLIQCPIHRDHWGLLSINVGQDVLQNGMIHKCVHGAVN
uniref:HAT C-terminal dimerisation domain-containing protein n=1 Tax=Panagrolaimus davidi TaxID=227884 RepID=A0A914PFI6_9BILA